MSGFLWIRNTIVLIHGWINLYRRAPAQGKRINIRIPAKNTKKDYSHQLVGTDVTLWEIIEGALPDGWTMSPTGLIESNSSRYRERPRAVPDPGAGELKTRARPRTRCCIRAA